MSSILEVSMLVDGSQGPQVRLFAMDWCDGVHLWMTPLDRQNPTIAIMSPREVRQFARALIGLANAVEGDRDELADAEARQVRRERIASSPPAVADLFDGIAMTATPSADPSASMKRLPVAPPARRRRRELGS